MPGSRSPHATGGARRRNPGDARRTESDDNAVAVIPALRSGAGDRRALLGEARLLDVRLPGAGLVRGRGRPRADRLTDVPGRITPGRITYPGAQQFLPGSTSLAALREAAGGCRGCDLYQNATQTVFGRGPRSASLMLVGEQPGDVEDREGTAFVGPAGRLLDRALAAAGLDGAQLYVTNAVKHFRWKEGRGKRRIHDKPTAAQATACRPWLAAEMHAVRPAVLVALGATAAGSLLGAQFRLTQHRGETLPWPPEAGDFARDETPVRAVVATIHPSAVLRAPDDERDAAYAGLVADLRVAAAALHTAGAG